MDIKLFLKNLYILPYIGGVLAIVSLFFPAATNFDANWSINSFTFWVWGLVCEIDWMMPGEGWIWNNYFYLSPDLLILLLGIVISALMIFLGVKMVSKARMIAKENKFINKSFVLYGALIILINIIWVVTVQLYFSNTGYFRNYFIDLDAELTMDDLSYLYLPIFSFWDYFGMNFGVIGPFIAGGLPIIGYLIHIIEYKRFDYLFIEDEENIKT
ncbi:MAG: hypothetical protein ACFE9Z_05130 [Promethearchaeota archaeon]